MKRLIYFFKNKLTWQQKAGYIVCFILFPIIVETILGQALEFYAFPSAVSFVLFCLGVIFSVLSKDKMLFLIVVLGTICVYLMTHLIFGFMVFILPELWIFEKFGV